MSRILSIMTAIILAMASQVAATQLVIEAFQVAIIRGEAGDSTGRILVHWELSSDLGSKIIDGASITMSIEATAEAPFSVDVMPLTRNWSASRVSWADGWSRAGGDYADSLPAPAIVEPGSEREIRINVYDAVLDHINGRRTNFGFVIIPDLQCECSLGAFAANSAGKLADAKLIIAYRNRR